MSRININNKKVLFLGYGAVGKCVWNFFDMYFTYNKNNIYAVDQFPSAFEGPGVELLHTYVYHVSDITFDHIMDKIGMNKGDIIIDVTYNSSTYFFIKRSIERGLHYLNTSIEDNADSFHGTSISIQQKTVAEIISHYDMFDSAILTECGQNPGVIQHYVFHALSEMNKLLPPKQRVSTYRDIIKKYKVGTIFCSEIDDQKHHSKNKKPFSPEVITNTWSVSGFLSEALDPTELVRGRNNSFIQPVIPKDLLYTTRMKLYPYKDPYEVLFLKEIGLHTTLPSICPIMTPNGIRFTSYRGKLIHHGELFDLARHFKEDTPFMSYVYKNNPYMDQSLQYFFKNHPDSNASDIIMYANQAHTFRVLDQRDGTITGQDSIGATLFCGKHNMERIFWCGSIVTDNDPMIKNHPYFTPTIIQVAAGVLSGLSYLLEHNCTGWYQSSDIKTDYMLNKCAPLLGHLFFTEIPVEQFNESLQIKIEKMIPQL